MTQTAVAAKPSRFTQKRIVSVLVAAWIIYLLAGALFTMTPIGPSIIAPHPERCSVTWDLAWTIIPGIAHVRGLEVKQHTRDVMWSLQVDRATTGVNLFALPFKTFHALLPRASGVTAVVKKAPTTMAPQEKKKPGFRLLFQAMSAKDIRTVDFYAAHIEGETFAARGTLDTTARGPFGIPRAKITLKGGRVIYDQTPVVTDLRLIGRAKIEKHTKDQIHETGFLPLASGRIEIEGDTADLAFVDVMVRSVDWINVYGGEGHIDGSIGMDHGVVESDSHLAVDTSAFTFSFMDYVASGQGALRFDGIPDQPEADNKLEFSLDDFELRFADSDIPYLKGKDLSAAITGKLGEMLRPGGDVSVTIDLPDSDVPDLTVYNRYLKAGESVEILSGTGRLASHLETSAAKNEGRGSIDLKAQGVILNVKDRPIVADMISNSVFFAPDLKKKDFSLDGTTIRLENVVVGTPDQTPQDTEVEDEKWWCDIEITDGELRFGKPIELDLNTTLTARDADPVVALMSKTQKGEGRLDKLLGIKDLGGSARILVQNGFTALLDIQAEGGRAELLGDLCMSRGYQRGLFYIRYGILSVTAEIDGEKRKKHMTGPRKFFVKKATEFSCGGVRPKAVAPRAD